MTPVTNPTSTRRSATRSPSSASTAASTWRRPPEETTPRAAGSRRGKLGYLGRQPPRGVRRRWRRHRRLSIVLEELAAAGCPLLLMVVSPAICGTVIARFGTDEQKQRWLPGIADGTRTMAFAITEPDAGSNSPQHHHDARRDGDELGAQRPQDLHLRRRQRRRRPRRRPHRGRHDRQAQALPVRRARPTPTASSTGRSRWRSSPREAVPALPRRRAAAGRRARRRRGRRAARSCSPGSTRSGSWRPRSPSASGRYALDRAVGVRPGAHGLAGADRRPPGHRAPARAGEDRARAGPADDAEGRRASTTPATTWRGRGGQHGQVRRRRGRVQGRRPGGPDPRRQRHRAGVRPRRAAPVVRVSAGSPRSAGR